MVFGAVLAALSATQATAGELLVNGGFETGTFAGWTVTDLAGSFGGSSFFIDTPGTTTPLSGNATSAVGSGGLFYAVSDQDGPGTHVLSQSFSWNKVGTLNLSFAMFANDHDGGPFDAGGLDHTLGPNQHVRVDILTAAASVFDTGAGVVQSIIAPMVDPQANNPNPFTNYAFDLSGLAAGSYQLRFGEVDNQLYLNMGVDNVSLTQVPAPGTLALFGLTLGILGFLRRRRC
jgi:hypothetical protein